MNYVITVGCFDLFHKGHYNLLSKMRQYGNKRFIGIHDDLSILINKKIHTSDKLDRRIQNVKQHLSVNDDIFIIRNANPTNDIKNIVENIVKNTKQRDNICFVRGDDFPNFPGRDYLEQNNVPIEFVHYTKNISSSILRKKYLQNVSIFPEKFTSKILEIHDLCIYYPIKSILEVICTFLPKFLTPNLITLLSLVCVIPIKYYILNGSYVNASFIFLLHDLLDRMDGAMANVFLKQKRNHNSQIGSYLDAICDKIFAILSYLCIFSNVGNIYIWKCIFQIKCMIHIYSFFLRTIQFMNKTKSIKSVSYGKLSTFCENLSFFTIMLFSKYQILPLYFISIIFSMISLDLSLQSIKYKLRFN